MATSDSERSVKKQVVLNGIKYEIDVRPFSGGMYQACWRCSACDEDGAWAPVSGDRCQAIELAEAGLEVHHAFLHGRVKLAPRRSV